MLDTKKALEKELHDAAVRLAHLTSGGPSILQPVWCAVDRMRKALDAWEAWEEAKDA